jgi:hypothetical protein
MHLQLSKEAFDFLLTNDTCSVENAIESFEVRLRNEGFSDQHGIVNVPLAIAEQLPSASARLRRTEAAITAFCRSKEFSVDGLHRLLGGDAPQT